MLPKHGRLPGATSLLAGVRSGRVQTQGTRGHQARGGPEGGGDQQCDQRVAVQDRRLPEGKALSVNYFSQQTLFQYVNNLYFDGQLDFSTKEGLKKGLEKKEFNNQSENQSESVNKVFANY